MTDITNYNTEKPEKKHFECSLCNYASKWRTDTFGHLKTHHAKEINLQTKNGIKSNLEPKDECEDKMCFRFYGRRYGF